MGNQAKRRAESEQRRHRARLIRGAVAVVAVVAAAAVGLSLLTGEDDDTEGWTLTNVSFDVVRPGDPDASDFEGHGYRVVFEVDWEGDTEEPPNRALPCTLEIRGEDGAILHEDEFGLYVGSGVTTRTWNPRVIEDDQLEGLPAGVSLECEEVVDGGYRLSEIEVVRGWRVTYVAAWRGEREPVVQACELQLIRDDDSGSPVYDEPIVLSPRMAGESQILLALPDELMLPADDAVVDCDLDEDDDEILD